MSDRTLSRSTRRFKQSSLFHWCKQSFYSALGKQISINCSYRDVSYSFDPSRDKSVTLTSPLCPTPLNTGCPERKIQTADPNEAFTLLGLFHWPRSFKHPPNSHGYRTKPCLVNHEPAEPAETTINLLPSATASIARRDSVSLLFFLFLLSLSLSLSLSLVRSFVPSRDPPRTYSRSDPRN